MKKTKEDNLKKFIPLILAKAPKHTSFSIYDIKDDLNLTDEDKRILVDLSLEIRVYLIDNGLAILKGSRKLLLIENKNDLNITNNFTNSTINQLNQESSFSNSPTTINKTPTQNKKSFIIKFFKLITENKLISGIILIIITEESIIGIVRKFICSYLDWC